MKKVILTASAFILAAGSGFAQNNAPAVPEENRAEQPDTLEMGYKDLDELVITAKKEVMRSDGAKLTYDLEQDQSSKGQSVLEALRKVPMVTVDGQDNIKIKGSGDFKIYVNGKEDPMLTANASRVLKSMPAESVSKIEVITEPGAKYDAEGTGGILNLVTDKKQTKDGYTGSVYAGYTSQNFQAGGYGRVRYGNVTADANINWADNRIQNEESIHYSETIDSTSDENYRQVSEASQIVKFDYIGASLNMSWEPNAHNLFTAGANTNFVDADVPSYYGTSSMYTRNGDLKWRFGQNATGIVKNIGASASASYKHSFNDAGQNLILSYFFDFGKNPMHITTLYEDIKDYPHLTPVQQLNTDNYQRSHTVTLDYTLPISDEKHLVEAGAKGVFRRNSSDSGTLTGPSEDQLIPDADNLVLTNQIQDVYALYGSYTGKFDKVSLKAGLRYEHTYMGMDFLRGNQENFRRHLNDLVPNGAITYMFGMANNLRLAYQMRIRRPGLEELNPYKMTLNDLEVRTGNPALESEKYHNISLAYSNYGQVLGGNVTLEYMQTDNSIEEYNYFEGLVQYTMPENLGKYRRVDLSGFLNWNINQKMTVTLSATINYTDIKSHKAGLKNHGWKEYFGLNWNYTGPWNMKYGAYGGWGNGNVELQGKNNGWHYYGLSIAKSFLKEEALTVTLTAGNFLNKYNSWKSWTYTDNRTVYNVFKHRSWSVGVNVSWNFGHLQERVKSTGASAGNDDTTSGKPANQGGGGSGIGL